MLICLHCFSVITAGAQDKILCHVNFADLGLQAGETYTCESFNSESMTGSETSAVTVNNDGSISLTAVPGKNGGSLSFWSDRAVRYGTVAVEVKVKKDTAYRSTARNLLMYSAEGGTLQRFLVLQPSGAIACESGAASTATGNFVKTNLGRYGTYTTGNEYYDLKVIFSRGSADTDWQVEVYDTATDAEAPFYTQSVKKEDLPNLQVVRFEQYKVDASETESFFTLKDFKMYMPQCLTAEMQFVNEADEVIEDLCGAEVLSAKGKVVNTAGYAQSCRLYFTLYARSALKGIVYQDLTVAAGSEETFSVSLETTDLAFGDMAKLFVWGADMQPVQGAKTIAYTEGGTAAWQGDTVRLEIIPEVIVSAQTVQAKNFVVTDEKGTQQFLDNAIYYPAQNLISLRLKDKPQGLAAYNVTGRGVTDTEGDPVAISGKVPPLYEVEGELYDTSVRRVELYKKIQNDELVAAAAADTNGTYVAKAYVNCTGKEEERTLFLYSVGSGKMTLETTQPVTAYCNTEQKFETELQLSPGDTVLAVIQ